MNLKYLNQNIYLFYSQVRDSCAEASACSLNLALFKAMEAARATNRYNSTS